jgi:hypothetical protein
LESGTDGSIGQESSLPNTLGPVARVMGLRTATVYAASVVMLTGLLGNLLNRLL